MSGNLWIAVTLFAVAMQAVRTAGQKQLTAHLDPISVTLVRFVFGLPFAIAFLLVVKLRSDAELPPVNATFLTFSALAGFSQIVATVALVRLFSMRNFAVGTTYARTEAFLTAFVGALVYGEVIRAAGWIAIVVSVAGVVLITLARAARPAQPLGARSKCSAAPGRFARPEAAVGLASGLGFALASLSIRKASLSFGIDEFLLSAGMVLVTTVVIQSSAMLGYALIAARDKLVIMMGQWRLCLFIGLTSALGSIGWFVAMTLERASYVKALGQIEFVLTLAISTLFFKERSSKLELAGMALVALGIVVLVAGG
ncbi:MAG: EamA family transporter [Gammaproteobacteria bacterium]